MKDNEDYIYPNSNIYEYDLLNKKLTKITDNISGERTIVFYCNGILNVFDLKLIGGSFKPVYFNSKSKKIYLLDSLGDLTNMFIVYSCKNNCLNIFDSNINIVQSIELFR